MRILAAENSVIRAVGGRHSIESGLCTLPFLTSSLSCWQMKEKAETLFKERKIVHTCKGTRAEVCSHMTETWRWLSHLAQGGRVMGPRSHIKGNLYFLLAPSLDLFFKSTKLLDLVQLARYYISIQIRGFLNSENKSLQEINCLVSLENSLFFSSLIFIIEKFTIQSYIYI